MIRVIYYGFTNAHFLETIRKWKIKYLTDKGLLDLDDESIFGATKKTWTIPEHTIIVKEYVAESYVEWDDWNDTWHTNGDDYYICACGEKHYNQR